MTHEHFHQESPFAVHEKGSVSDETFDDFLAEQGLLQACENHAIKEISEGLNEVGLMDKNTSVADLLSMPPEVFDVDFDPPRLTAKL